MSKLALSSVLFALIPALAACEEPGRIPASSVAVAKFHPGMLEALPGMLDQIGAFIAAPQTVTVYRDDTTDTTLQLVGLVDLSPSVKLRIEVVPDLRADGVAALIDGWTGGRPVAIEWEGTFEHLTAEGDALRIGVDAVPSALIDEEIRTLCGATQRVRAFTWITVDGQRHKALVSLGVQEGPERRARDAVSETGISAGGNCQIKWYFGGYSWCENTAGTENGSCTFVQQVTQSTASVCLSGTVAGGVGSGSGITVGGGGGSGTATGTWGTVTQMVYATFPGACIHVDGWLEDYCECRATASPTYSVVPLGCSSGSGTCTSPTSCPSQ